MSSKLNFNKSSNLLLKDLPIFYQPWWLNIVAPDQWKYLCAPNCTNPKIVWPIYIMQGSSFKQIKMPVFTPIGGPRVLNKPQENPDVSNLAQMLDDLDVYSSVKQHLPPRFDSLDLFSERGYEIRKRRTFQIDTTCSEEMLFSSIKSRRKNYIRRGNRDYTILINEKIKDQVQIVLDTLSRKDVTMTFEEDVLYSLITSTLERDQGQIMTALTPEGHVAASIFIIWDNYNLYYLLGGYTAFDKSSCGMSSLIWNAILEAKKKHLIFDFEGSMDDNIASFFRSFGSVETTYYEVEKINSRMLRTVKKMKNLL